MTEPYGLCGLQVRVASHEDVNVQLGEFGTCLQQRPDVFENVAFGLDDPKSCVCGDLIVPRSPGVELPSEWADQFGESSFIGGMYVLVTGLEGECPCGPFGVDLFET